MKALQFTNTLTRKKELFIPQVQNKVSLYVCGVTPYAHSHIGHGRSYINFDVLVRFLRLIGYQVTYIRNVTDIDDKLLRRAEEEHGDQFAYDQVARKFTKAYREDMQTLGCLEPDREPLATAHIDKMISFIDAMVKKGDAYVAGHDVYFSVENADGYGTLSGKVLEELQAGARIQINEQKRHPADFVLWKGNGQRLFWRAPWGYGRPGWHIECSAMAHKYLGDTLDIHGGGADLIFPHHENEIAQSQSVTGKPFATTWLHNALLNIDKEKMSKSLGNTFSLRAVFEKCDPMVFRFYILQHHYRTPIEFEMDHIVSARVAYKKLVKLFEDIETQTFTREEIESNDIADLILDALADDLNTPRALGIIFEHAQALREDKQTAAVVKFLLSHVFGLSFELLDDKVEITPEIQDLIDQRQAARAAKDWQRADQIRDQLIQLGYNPHDTKS